MFGRETLNNKMVILTGTYQEPLLGLQLRWGQGQGQGEHYAGKRETGGRKWGRRRPGRKEYISRGQKWIANSLSIGGSTRIVFFFTVKLWGFLVIVVQK